MARNTLPALDENGVDWAASGIADYFARADFVHVSNEVSFFADCPQPSDQMLGGNSSFCSKPEHFALLERLGVDFVELSGNHNNDYGYQAYKDTLDWYRQRGMRTVGGGETLEEARAPLIIEHNGNRVAWIACNWVGPYYALVEESPNALGGPRPGAAACDRDWLRESVQTLSAAYDLLIVSVQYTERDQHPPTPEQQADFAQLATWGADVVIGTQAHFTQTYDLLRGRGGKESFIHYGPGNFIFDQPFWAGTRFMLDRLLIYDGLLVNVEAYPGIIDGLARPRPMTADERLNFAHVLFVQNGGL
jgi:poly-gamma-glutamate synthesis protein (capsule biosynthesis protein)